MAKVLDWGSEREMWIRVLKQQTGEGLDIWNQKVKDADPTDDVGLRRWLAENGVTGYAATVLVMEHFGYPDWASATADELVDNQYADREALRPIYEAILLAMAEIGEFTIQTRKTYVSLVTPRRTFARIKPSTKSRLDLGLRLDGQEPGGRLKPSKLQETMRVQLSFNDIEQFDDEARSWLKRAYLENC